MTKMQTDCPVLLLPQKMNFKLQLTLTSKSLRIFQSFWTVNFYRVKSGRDTPT